MHKRKPYRKKFDEDRQTCTFRTTQNDRANIDKAREFFSLQNNKKVSKNVAINSAIEYIARIHCKNVSNLSIKPNNNPIINNDILANPKTQNNEKPNNNPIDTQPKNLN